MINRFFFLFLGGIILSAFSANAYSAEKVNMAHNSMLYTQHTQTYALELEPVSFDGAYQTAAICFLGDNCNNDSGFTSSNNNDDMTVDTANQCAQEGYVKLNCNSVQQASGLCPYNSGYGKECVCKGNLMICASNQIGVGDSCGGKYQSCTCKPEFQYTASNCASPRSLSGSSCSGKYSSCVCPSGVSTGAFGCKEYYPSPCGSVCKTANTDNCHQVTDVTTPYGCMSYYANCSSKCERPYTDNCRNRTAVTATHGCQTYWADCSTKCQTAFNDNCRNRTAVTAPYGCAQSFADCPTKCQIAYADNCHNRASVAAPYGCQQAFSDCNSKCQVAYTNNCHNRTAVATPYGCAQYFADCSSKCQIAKTNPDCDVTSLTCSAGCKTTNSCGKCTQCETPKTCEYYGLYTSRQIPLRYWMCEKILHAGLSCWDCIPTKNNDCEPYIDPQTGRWVQCAIQ